MGWHSLDVRCSGRVGLTGVAGHVAALTLDRVLRAGGWFGRWMGAFMVAMDRRRRALLHSTTDRAGWTIGDVALVGAPTLGTVAGLSGVVGTGCILCLVVDLLVLVTSCSLYPVA